MNDHDSNNHKLITGFEYLLRSKGYVGYFELYHGNRHGGVLMTATLGQCLRHFIASGRSATKLPAEFTLGFDAVQRAHDDYIRCFLKVEFNSQTGFEIKEIDVQSENPYGRRVLPVSSNHQLPNVNSVKAIFPRPALWKQIMKNRLKGKGPW